MHNYGLHLLETRLADIKSEQETIEHRIGKGWYSNSSCLYNSDEYLTFGRNVERIEELELAIAILKDGLNGQQTT